jgi:hypothetical protein
MVEHFFSGSSQNAIAFKFIHGVPRAPPYVIDKTKMGGKNIWD